MEIRELINEKPSEGGRHLNLQAGSLFLSPPLSQTHQLSFNLIAAGLPSLAGCCKILVLSPNVATSEVLSFPVTFNYIVSSSYLVFIDYLFLPTISSSQFFLLVVSFSVAARPEFKTVCS